MFQDASISIECNFKFMENVPDYPKDDEFIVMNENMTEIDVNMSTKPFEPFDCDDPEDEEDPLVESRFNFDSFNPDDDDYETVTTEYSCEKFNQTIYPQAMNNVNNVMVPILNNNLLTQSIQIEKCL